MTPTGWPSDAEVASLPKVSLHDHLDGGLAIETLLELALETGLALPADTPDGLRERLRPRGGSLVEYLTPFALIAPVLQRPENLRRIAREHVLTLAAENVIHAELRWAPSAHLSAGMTRAEAVDAVAEGIADGVAEARSRGAEISVGQILCILRGAESGMEIAELALSRRDAGVLGVDLAGDEAAHPVTPHAPAFDLLAREFMPVTIHAGEAAGVPSIAEALVEGGALRLGHGVRIAEDIEWSEPPRLGRVASWIRDRGIAVETCPSSNLHTGAVTASTIAEHPLADLDRLGFAVTVSTDNRLLSDTTLTRELLAVRDHLGYDTGGLRRLQLTAARASFLPADARDSLVARLEAGPTARPAPRST